MQNIQSKIVVIFLLLFFASVFLIAKKSFPSTIHSLILPSSKHSYHLCTLEEADEFPHLCSLLESIHLYPLETSQELYEFAKMAGTTIEEGQILLRAKATKQKSERLMLEDQNHGLIPQLPSVLAHGMGDSCFNSGMISLTARVSQTTGTYATCIPTGDNLHEDTINGYFLNMDASIEVFAQKVRSDGNLKNGFNALGFSQGNNVIRGYIARHNDPPVVNFISVNGVNAGIGAVPYCMPKSASKIVKNSRICNSLMETASHRAYSAFAQKHSFQANYWRDPRSVEKENYFKFSQLAHLNNEVPNQKNLTLNENYRKTSRFVWVMATDDRVVWPPEGEHWGEPSSEDPFNTIVPMNQTEWFTNDFFGLKTADLEGKNIFESFAGNHLQFDIADFDRWVTSYFND